MINLQLSGLHCDHCVNSVEKALKQLPTVTQLKIDLTTQVAQIESQETAATLIKAIEEIGFEAKQIS